MNTYKLNQTTGSECKTLACTEPAKVFSLKFLYAYIITMRPYLLFVSGITGIAGLSYAPDTNVIITLVLGSAFFLSYGFGQALTDCFQMDTDSLSSPYRPLVQGKIREKDVLIISICGLAAIGIVISMYNFINLPLTFIAALGLATYTYFKRRWWAGPFYNSWIVMLLCIIAYLSSGAFSNQLLTGLPFIAALVMVFFGYANFVLTGYYKDISADRQTGYNTLPVVFGLKVSTRISDLFALFAVSGCIISIYSGICESGVFMMHSSFVFLFPGFAALLIGQIQLHRTRSETDSHKAIVPVVHSYILLLSAAAAANKPSWTPALIIFYAAFVITMKLRPTRQQI